MSLHHIQVPHDEGLSRETVAVLEEQAGGPLDITAISFLDDGHDLYTLEVRGG